MRNLGVQMSKIQQIANDDLPLFWKEPRRSIWQEQKTKVPPYIFNSSSDNFNHVDVYPFVVRKCYDIGKAVKNF
jgi:hypothetical protein